MFSLNILIWEDNILCLFLYFAFNIWYFQNDVITICSALCGEKPYILRFVIGNTEVTTDSKWRAAGIIAQIRFFPTFFLSVKDFKSSRSSENRVKQSAQISEFLWSESPCSYHPGQEEENCEHCSASSLPYKRVLSSCPFDICCCCFFFF